MAGATTAAAHRYLTYVKPLNRAIATFDHRARHWGEFTGPVELRSDARPAIRALTRFRRQLSTSPWPFGPDEIVDLLRGDVTIVRDDLELVDDYVLHPAAWVRDFNADSRHMKTDSDRLRHALGLTLGD